MRILLAVHGFPPTHYAGAERVAERIVKGLVARGHEVEVFAVENVSTPGFRVETTPEDGFIIHRLYYDVKEGDTFRNLYDYPPVGDALRQILQNRNFDLIHLISGYLIGGQVAQVASEAGLPFVITLTEYWFMCPRLNLMHPNDALCSGPESDHKCARCLFEEKRRYRLPAQVAPNLMNAFWAIAQQAHLTDTQVEAVALRRETLRKALESADLVISPSRFLIDKFTSFGFNTKQFELIRHGISTPPLNNKEPQRKSGELCLGYIGQIKAHKGVDLIIEAVLPLLDAGEKFRVELWGPDGEVPEYTERLKEMTAPYPSIHWKGRYNKEKLWDILDGFDVLIVPSRWYENSPLVILEARHAGLPVIATRLGGMAEMVHHERSGLLFTLNDAADLREQIARLVHDTELLERLRAGVPPVKQSDEELDEIFAHYERLVEQESNCLKT
ncbi:MAG: glycosyltransferase family 4 protein [Chloroflexi bacterium]|nr:glycosyltransferase family 4 protein [Chloroflexota bacterium]